jgi:AcrR family transcriptional regulator
VGRRPQPRIRERLLDACADHVLVHGLPDRLEPLATATGTSARMLIHHFGTRDSLLRAVLGHARQRQLDTFGDLLRVRPEEPYTATLNRAWTSITGPDGRPYLRMFDQLRESAEQQLWPDPGEEAWGRCCRTDRADSFAIRHSLSACCSVNV